MIDREIFNRWIAVFADRFNRGLEAPTIGVWYELLSRELSTSEFEAACAIAFRDSTYWPTPKELIEFVRPTRDVGLEATEAFRRLMKLGKQIDGYGRNWARSDVEAELGPIGIRCFEAIGANERLRHMSTDDFPHVRREFIAAYRAAAAEKERVDRADRSLDPAQPMPSLADGRRPRRAIRSGSGKGPEHVGSLIHAGSGT